MKSLEITRSGERTLYFSHSILNPPNRSDPSSTLTTLAAYLEATHHLLSLILQIPPVDPSAFLRTALILRLTGDVLHPIPDYAPDTATPSLLLAWLTYLDQGWFAVLRAQAWDADACVGCPLSCRRGRARRR